MHTHIHANLDNIGIYDVPQKIKLRTLNKKRWSSAILVIYCSRAFIGLIRQGRKIHDQSVVGNKNIVDDDNFDKEISSDPDWNIVIDVVKDFSCFYDIDEPTLTKLVKEKNLKKLDEFDGVQGIAASLSVNIHHGINGDDEEDILRRNEAFGNNTYHKPQRKSFFYFVWKSLKNPTNFILLALGAVLLGFGIKKNGTKQGWYDGGSIFVAIFVVISISTIYRFNQSRQFDKLFKISDDNIIGVLRNGRKQKISAFEIVVGDVVCLKTGDQVPADGLFIDGHLLHVNESSISWEKDCVQVNKTQNPFLNSGTKVADGDGKMLVTCVGMSTTWGESMSSVSRNSCYYNEKTHLQKRLKKLTSAVQIIYSVISLVTIVICYLQSMHKNEQHHSANNIINVVVEFIFTAISTAIVAIPGGLPLVFAIAISYSLRRLMEDKVMVPNLSACEAMNSVTTVCIALAHRQELPGNNDDDDLTLVGILGLKDPCKEDGMNIKLITGNNILIAKEIANECGILLGLNMDGSVIIEGGEFRNFTDEERMEKVDEIVVLADATPFDKELMVKSLKQKGHFVAVMTGDGANDGFALREADIGVLMGIQATNQVTKERTDIIILDGNFSSMVKVLRLGRCIYSNIQKFTQFQLTPNISGLLINFVTSISTEFVLVVLATGRVPLTALEVLWVNLIINPLGALAFATETPTKEQMKKLPRPVVVGGKEPLITNIMWRNILGQALYQIGVILTLQLKGESVFGLSQKVNDTLVYNTFVLCQVANQINARRLVRKNVFEGIHKNKLFLVIASLTIVVQLLMVEFLKRFVNIERLDWVQWGASIGIAAASWPIGLLIKFIYVTNK